MASLGPNRPGRALITKDAKEEIQRIPSKNGGISSKVAVTVAASHATVAATFPQGPPLSQSGSMRGIPESDLKGKTSLPQLVSKELSDTKIPRKLSEKVPVPPALKSPVSSPSNLKYGGSTSSTASPSKGTIPRNQKMTLVQAMQPTRTQQVRVSVPDDYRDNTSSFNGSRGGSIASGYNESISNTPRDGIKDDVSVASSTPRSTTSVGSQSSISSDAKWTTRGYSQSTGSTSSRRSSSTPPDADGKRKRSSRSMHIGFDGCSIDLESEHRDHPGSWQIKDFSEIFKDNAAGENITFCVNAYEMTKPTKLQAHSIAAIVRSIKRNKGGKSCIMVQGPSGTGKTSAVVLAVLAILDQACKHLQAIVLSGSTMRDFDKYFTVFTALQADDSYHTLKSCFSDMTPIHWDPGTQILSGRPKMILHLLGQEKIVLDYVRVLIIDDAHDLAAFTEKPTNTPLDDVIQICNILEAQGIPSSKMTYVILSQGGDGHYSRKVTRLLKSSVLKKKNLLSVQDMPTKLRMHVKHYYVQAPRQEWTKIMAGLVRSLMFPRVIVFCDDRKNGIEYFPNKMRTLNLDVSVNVGSGDTSDEIRRTALQDFSAAKTQFLFTTSEPSTCQIVLPKVSCVFHLDVPGDLLSVYGVRLLPLDSQNRSDAVSVVFVENNGGPVNIPNTKIIDLEKLFGIKFMDMPFEFIPN